MAWSVIASVASGLVGAAPAAAASGTYTFTSAGKTAIVGKNTDYLSIPLPTLTFNKTGSNFYDSGYLPGSQGIPPGLHNITISNLLQTSPKTYSAVLTDITQSGGAGQIKSQITVDDPFGGPSAGATFKFTSKTTIQASNFPGAAGGNATFTYDSGFGTYNNGNNIISKLSVKAGTTCPGPACVYLADLELPGGNGQPQHQSITITDSLGTPPGATGTFTLTNKGNDIAATDFLGARGGNADFVADGGYYLWKSADGSTTAQIYNLQPIKGSSDFTASLAEVISGTPGSSTPTTIRVLNPHKYTPSVVNDPSNVDVPETCNAGPHFTWLICGAIKVMILVVDWIRDNIVVPFLHEPPFNKNDPNIAPAYQIWSGFRNVASVFFILVFFLIVFGTAIGWDNYTVKKVMPRLVLGAVLVPLSWYLCVVVIDIGNIFGQGLVTLISPLVPPANIDFTSGLSKLVLGGVLIGATAAATTAIATIGMGVVVSMLIAFLMVFFTLVLRKILITLLVVISPFAILMWILPNTSKWFKEWWSNFFKLVMMYPLIIMLFEAGRIFAATAGTTSGNSVEKGVIPLFQLVGLTLPLFGVPFAFKWAGAGLAAGQNVLGKAGGALNKRYGKDSDAAKQAAERRRDNNARRALDTDNNKFKIGKKEFDSKTLGAMRRGAALKRSGLGGFTGASNIPGLRNSAAQKQRLFAAADKAESEEALSRAQDEERELLPESAKHRIDKGTDAEYDKMLDQRALEASNVVGKDGQRIREIPLGPEGITQLKERFRQAKHTGDTATQIAVLQRLSGSQGGINGAMQLRTGEKFVDRDTEMKADTTAVRDTTMADGSVVRKGQTIRQGSTVRGGNYVAENANEAGASAAVNLGAAGWSVQGGHFDTATVAPENKTVWDKGTAKAKAGDANKPLIAATNDISAEDVAGMSDHEVRRYLDYYERNSSDPYAQRSAEQFNSAFQIAMESPMLKGKVLPETVKAVAKAAARGNPGVNQMTAEVANARAAELAPVERTVSAEASRQILAATGGDVVRASQIHNEIKTQIEASPLNTSALNETIERKMVGGGTLDASDFAHIALPTQPSAMPDAMRDKLATQLQDNLSHLAEVHQGYQSDTTGAYRRQVRDALNNGKIPPVPFKF